MTGIKNAVAAFQFLTIIPLPIKTSMDHLQKSMAWYPLVGAVIGLFTGFGYQFFLLCFPQPIAAVLGILLYIVLTRGLHLDGYMDTIDGFYSHRGREDILHIMKDPQVGSFAAIGLGIWCLLLYGALPMMTPMDHVIIHTFTRFGILLMPLLFSYPRESGTGKFFVENVKNHTLAAAFALVLAILASLYSIAPYFPGEFNEAARSQCFIRYGIMGIICVLVPLLTGLWSRRKIGGITGDVVGFAIEATHLWLLLAITSLLVTKLL
ncbi:MAG: adenosylcobinamide-GDP ribazoletransferase [bacterium]|nr:adenosylcobinamide-GDP ribazoletransferase [bacterium]